MPGFVGFFDEKLSRDAQAQLLEKMRRAITIPAFRGRVAQHIAGPVALAYVAANPWKIQSMPALDPKFERWLMVDGELWDVASLRTRLKSLGAQVEGIHEFDVAGWMLSAWKHLGPRFFTHLSGSWTMVLGQGHRSWLVTDRFGSRQLFVAEDGDRTVFSSELKGVAAGRKKLSKPGGPGLFALLSGAAHFGSDTWLEDLRLMPPASLIELGLGTLKAIRYWRPRIGDPEQRGRSTDEAAGEMASMIRESTRRIAQSDPQRAMLRLSGGLSSRVLAASLAARPAESGQAGFGALSFGGRSSMELRVAREVSRRLKLSHQVFVAETPERIAEDSRRLSDLEGAPRTNDGFFSVQLDRVLWATEGLLPFPESSTAIWEPSLPQKLRLLLDGSLGDALSGESIGPELMSKIPRGDVIRRIYARYLRQDPELLRLVLRPSYYRRHRGALFERFVASFADLDAARPMTLETLWDLENRQRRWALLRLRMSSRFLKRRAPFLDYGVADFFLGLPERWRVNRGLLRRMLARHYPELTEIPLADTGEPASLSNTQDLNLETFNWARTRLMRKGGLRREMVPKPLPIPVTDWMQQETRLSEMLIRMTHSEAFPSEVFDAEGIRALVQDFGRFGGNPRSLLACHLIGVLRSMELIFHGGEISLPPSADPGFFGLVVADEPA